MKKILLFSVLALVISVHLFAQTIPNNGFETWASGQPQGWYTTNQLLSQASLPPNVVKDSINVHSGTYAVKISTVTASVFTVAGAAVAGSATPVGITSVVPSGGFPYTSRAQTFTGFYEYTPATGDSCLIQAWLFKRNASTHNRDTVAWITFKEAGAVSSYTQFSSNFTYHSGAIGNETPDSALILLCSSHVLAATGPKAGSSLWVDDLSFTGSVATAVKEVKKENATTIIYPNPAANEVNLKTNLADAAKINVFDVLGKKVKSIYVNSLVTTFPVNDLNNGLYFYQLMNNYEEILTTGRFSVKN